MVLNKGGYVIFDINENDETLYERAKNVVLCGKPILVYDGYDEDNPLIKYCYWADDKRLEQRIFDGVTINYVIITSGGVTIEVSEDNSVTISGKIQNHLYKYNVVLLNDDDGYKLHFTIYYNGTLEEDIDVIWDLLSQGDIGYDMSDNTSCIITSIGSTSMSLNVSGTETSYNKAELYVEISDSEPIF